MSEALPTEMLARVHDLAADLLVWVRQHRAAPLLEHEQAVLGALPGAAPGVLATVLRRGTGSRDAGPAPAAAAEVVATPAAAERLDPAPGILLVEADGLMLHYLDGWHEAKVGLVAGHQNGRTTAASYVAARAGPTEFGPRLLAEAARRGA